MTNVELKNLFDRVHDSELDGIEILMELGKNQEEYNASEFYKTTNLSIYEAYSHYFNTVLTFKNLLNIVQAVINNIDYSTMNDNLSIETLFNQIPVEYQGVFKELLESIK